MNYTEFLEYIISKNLDSSNPYWDSREKIIANYGGEEQIKEIYYLTFTLANMKGWEYALSKVR